MKIIEYFKIIIFESIIISLLAIVFKRIYGFNNYEYFMFGFLSYIIYISLGNRFLEMKK